MPSERVRFGLAEMMALVAATGLSLLAFTLVDDGLFGGQRFFFGVFQNWPGSTLTDWVNRAAGFVAVFLVLFGGWTLALPVLALRAGRRRWRRFARRPGIAACLAATLGMAAWAAVAGLMIWLRTRVEQRAVPPAFWSVSPVFDGLLASAGVAVAAVWSVQILTGQWRSQPNAHDRIGRCLGLMWLAVGAVFAAKRLIP